MALYKLRGKMAIHIKDIKEAITLIKETQVSLRRLSRLITNEEIRTLSAKVDRFLEDIEIDVYTDWDIIENEK